MMGSMTAAFVLSAADPDTSDLQPSTPRMNVILISIDTLRADHVGTYGYHRPTTPFIDSLASRGVLFEQAYSHSCKTAISHMSIMTGLLPENHGVTQWKTGGSPRLSDSIPTLATLLRSHGYSTAGFHGGGHIRAELGFDQGMRTYRKLDIIFSFQRMRQNVLPIVAAERVRPFFIFIHTYAVHDPYVPPEPYSHQFSDPEYDGSMISSRTEMKTLQLEQWHDRAKAFWAHVDKSSPADVQRLQDLYDGALVQIDEQLRQLFDSLKTTGAIDRTIVIVLSDHGEEFGEHGQFTHEQLYQELLHVPFIVVLPEGMTAAKPGARISPVARMIDVAPTILDLLDLPTPEHMQGASLVPLLNGGAAPPPEVASSWRGGGLESIRIDRWKLIRQLESTGSDLLFDLDKDPTESRNLANRKTEINTRLASRMSKLFSTGNEYRSALKTPETVKPDQETLDQLRALGYIQ